MWILTQVSGQALNDLSKYDLFGYGIGENIESVDKKI
jgi:hypothetical protein